MLGAFGYGRQRTRTGLTLTSSHDPFRPVGRVAMTVKLSKKADTAVASQSARVEQVKMSASNLELRLKLLDDLLSSQLTIAASLGKCSC